jgi:hypothetical protein
VYLLGRIFIWLSGVVPWNFVWCEVVALVDVVALVEGVVELDCHQKKIE